MRYKDKTVSYFIEKNCTSKKKSDIIEALAILEGKTLLTFVERDQDPELVFYCSKISETPDEAGHFIAGEGGPAPVINATHFSVILGGKVSLFRDDTCDKPQIATHEILHALGFDHNNNESSIMFPITKCNQEIDQYILDEINRLYKINSFADLTIEKVKANRTGKSLNFEITVANYGLKSIDGAILSLYANNKKVSAENLDNFDIGARRKYTGVFSGLPTDADIIQFSVETLQPEITLDNNNVTIRAIKK